MKRMKNWNMFLESLNEAEPETEKLITTIEYDDEHLGIYVYVDVNANTSLYAITDEGEQYIDINKIIPENKLIQQNGSLPIWVSGKIETDLADILVEKGFLEKSTGYTQSGYNKYVMYIIKK